MKIQIASDLHLDFYENRAFLEKFPLIPKGEILLLAGDIVSDAYKDNARTFYDRIERDFPLIISTPGNHEYYAGALSTASIECEEQMSQNHVRLNNKSFIFKDIRFIVSTLWSYVSREDAARVQMGLNDYSYIFKSPQDRRRITVDDTNVLHRLSVDFIRGELTKKFEGQTVVLTHHLPSYRSLTKDYKCHPLNAGFASHLDYLIESNPQISLWVCGHSHEFKDVKICKTRVVRNPLGYVDDGNHTSFRRDFVVNV